MYPMKLLFCERERRECCCFELSQEMRIDWKAAVAMENSTNHVIY